LQIWDYRTGQIMLSQLWRQGPGNSWLDVLLLAFSPNSNRFVFTLQDRICIGQLS
jgi:hypothetical protein